MRNILLLLFIVQSFVACKGTSQEASDSAQQQENQEIAFDDAKWKTKEGRDYPYRNAMLDDVMASDTLRKLYREEVLDLLGQPDKVDTGYLFYRITQRRIGAWPLNTKTLVIKFYEDSTAEWIKIHE